MTLVVSESRSPTAAAAAAVSSLFVLAVAVAVARTALASSSAFSCAVMRARSSSWRPPRRLSLTLFHSCTCKLYYTTRTRTCTVYH